MKFANKQLILFIVGICGGIVLANLIDSEWLSGTELLQESALFQARYAVIDNRSLFLCLLGQRLGAAVLLILLSTTFLGLVAVWFYALRYGFSLGILIAALFSERGIMGMLLLLAGLFPQILLYAPAWMLLLALAERTCRRLYYLNGNEGLSGLKRMGIHLSAQSGLLLFVLAAGCWLESYVNPVLLRLALRLL
ncbi:MAG: stage II sporulation protein M [bacterium]|nr:stage II sporulation protein M [bacterium]MCM1375956.1 stage II sporulation protein M [Muribaculum sp.]